MLHPELTRYYHACVTLSVRVQNTAGEEQQNREQQLREARWAREQEEKDAKRQADKEKLLREDATRKDAMEKQRLLSLLEQPLVNLLERLNLRDELSLPLAQSGVLSLTNLRNLDQVSLAQTLGLEELAKSTGREDLGELCALAILSARRDLALQAIEAIPLLEDAEMEKEMEAQKAAEEAAAEEAAPWSSQFKGAPSSSTPGASAGGVYGFTEEPVVIKRDGPFRKKLFAVTERWHDYLATKPELGSLLASEDSAVPLWKDTVAWGLWMLSSTTPGKKHTSGQRFMGKEIIEDYFRCARDYVWLALYPIFKTYSRGEWRLYWKRVLFNFDRFFSDTGRRRWIELAALDARTKAIYARKSPREQDVAEKRGVAMVTSMLRMRSEAKCTSESVERLYNSPRRGQLLLAEASPEYRAYLEGGVNQLRRSFSFPERRPSDFNSPFGSLGSASVRFGFPSSPGSFDVRRGRLPPSFDFSPSPTRSRSFTPRSARSLTMEPYGSRSSYALSPFGPRYTPGAYAQQRPSSLPVSPLGLLKWRGRARSGDNRDDLADVVAHARRAARKAKEAELIEQRTSAAVEDAERVAMEVSKDAARQAAAQHKGRRGSIASAATIAAAIVREQAAARERLQQAEMQRRRKMAEATNPAPTPQPQPATVPVAPGAQPVPMLKDTPKPPSRLPPSQRTADKVKTPRSSRRASSTPRSRSPAVKTPTSPAVPIATSTTAEVIRRPLVPGPTHLADTKVKTPRSAGAGAANPSSPRSRRTTSATKGKSPSAVAGGSSSEAAASSIIQHL